MDLTNSIPSPLPLPPPPIQIPLISTPSFLMDHPPQEEEEEQPQRGEDYDLMSGWARSLSVSPRLFPTYSLGNNNGNSNASGSGTHNNSFGIVSGSGSGSGGASGVGSPLLSGRKDLPTVGTGLSPLLGPTHIGSSSNSLGVGSSSSSGMLMASGQGGSYDYNTFGQYHTNPPDGIPHHHSTSSTSNSSLLHNPFPSHISNHHSPLSESYTNPLLSNNNNNNNNNNDNNNSNHSSHALSYSNLNPISPKLNSTQSFSSSLPPNSNSHSHHSNTQPSPTLNPTALDPTSTLSLSNLAASNILDQEQDVIGGGGGGGEEDPRIRAYAKLEFPTFDIYIQKLSVIVGRRPAAPIVPNVLPPVNLPVAVPIPYGALGGGVENPVVRRSPSLSGESGNVGGGGSGGVGTVIVEEVKLEDFLLGIGEDDDTSLNKKLEVVEEGGDSLIPVKFEDSTTTTTNSNTALIIPNLIQALPLPSLPGLSLTPSSPRGGAGDLTTREEDEDEQRDFSEFLKSSPPPPPPPSTSLEIEIEENKLVIEEIKQEEEVKLEVDEPMMMESAIIPSPPPPLLNSNSNSNSILPSSLTSHISLPPTSTSNILSDQQQQVTVPAPILTDIDLGPIRAVSRQHARLYFDYELGGWAIEVLGRNGVVVEGTWKAKGEKEPLGKRFVESLFDKQSRWAES